jgi:hypothetical protein
MLADPVALFSGARETYLAQAVAESVATHAYVTLDGQWLSAYTGDRGWDAHVQEMAAYLDSLPLNIMIARTYCHSRPMGRELNQQLLGRPHAGRFGRSAYEPVTARRAYGGSQRDLATDNGHSDRTG